MTIRIECESCYRTIKVKDELAGRNIRCPDCQNRIRVPDSSEEPLPEPELPPLSRLPKLAGKSGMRSKQFRDSKRPWAVRQWHWLAVLAILLLALWPGPGLKIAGLAAGVGVLMVFVGGLAPFLRIVAGAPGTVLLMVVSRQARFDMMNQPDDHPYKVLVRSAFNPTRGLFWRGVLLIVVFIPAAMINQSATTQFQNWRQIRAPIAAPGRHEHIRAVGGDTPHHNGRFPRPGFPEQMPGQKRPSSGSNSLFYVAINYKTFAGTGTPTAGAKEALANLQGYIPDSAVVDETTKSIQFQFRDRPSPAIFMPTFGRYGFKSMRIRASTKRLP